MDNFDFKKYLAENRIHADHDLLSEKKEDSKKGNKEEQKRLEGAIRDNRDHKFDIDKDEDDQRKKLAKLQKDAKKEDGKGKKGNKDEQKRAEGAIRDAKDHKKNLDKDIKADEKKLAKLKKDFKKDVVKENEQVDESALAVAAGVASVFGGAAAMAKIMDKLEAGDLGEKGKKVADVLSQLGKGAANRYNEGIEEDITEGDPDAAARGLENIINGISKALNKSKEWVKKNVDVGSMQKAMSESEEVEEGYGKPMYDEDDTDPVKEQSSKMRVSELKAKIREDILSTLNEDEDVDVDVDFEDEVNVDAEGDDIEIEKPAVKAKVQVGLSPEETIVQDSLKAAMDAADALGNDKLADQIGNTITFFTREYVVGRNTD
jgi:urease accessory protein UreE